MIEDIPDLQQKMHFLHTGDYLARRIAGLNDKKGLKPLCALLDIDRSTIRDQLKQDKIRSDFEIRIAKRYGFHEREPAWTKWRSGTAADFKCAFAELHKNTNPDRISQNAQRRTDVPLVPVYDRQEAGSHRLTSLRLETVLSNDSERWPMKIHLRCRVANGIGIKKGFLDLYCGEAIAPEHEQSFQEAFNPPGTMATIRIHATTETRPSWEVSSKEYPLDDVRPEEPYCAVRKLGTGDTVTASFVIADKNLSGPEDYICKSDGKPVGRNKKAVLDRIASAAVLHNDDGYIVLCRHSVCFEDAYAGLRQSDEYTDNDKQDEN